jgi:hypothetical protein
VLRSAFEIENQFEVPTPSLEIGLSCGKLLNSLYSVTAGIERSTKGSHICDHVWCIVDNWTAL